jgi:hypothetical protein
MSATARDPRIVALISEAERLAPKRLGLSDSGIRAAVRGSHADTVRSRAPTASAAPAPEQAASEATTYSLRCRSARRSAADGVVAQALHEALIEAHTVNPDLGAAIDMQAAHARQVRIGLRHLSAGSVLLVVGGLPPARVAFLRRYLPLVAGAAGVELFLRVCVEVFGVQAVLSAVANRGEQ